MKDLKDPGMRAFLQECEQFYPPNAVELSVEEQRACYNKLCQHFLKPYPEGVTAGDYEIEGIPVRHYMPSTAETDTIIVYAHGGGFVVGDLDSHDDVCAELCAHAGAELVAIHYRLAPEHPFPAAFDDCWAVARTVMSNGAKVVLAGDSAGAKLSAAVALKARDEGICGVLGQVLIYGAYGLEPVGGSYEEHAEAPGLTTADVKFYSDIYFGKRPNPNWENKFARPLMETDYSGLPPAFLVAAGIDPLFDDTFAYAGALKSAGVPAETRAEPDLVHGFLRARHMSAPAREGFAAISDAVRRFCHGGD